MPQPLAVSDKELTDSKSQTPIEVIQEGRVGYFQMQYASNDVGRHATRDDRLDWTPPEERSAFFTLQPCATSIVSLRRRITTRDESWWG